MVTIMLLGQPNIIKADGTQLRQQPQFDNFKKVKSQFVVTEQLLPH